MFNIVRQNECRGRSETRGSVCSPRRRRTANRGNSSTIVLTSRPQAVGGLRLRLADVSQHIREAADKVLHPGIFPLGRIQLEPIHGPVVFQHLMPGRVRDRMSFWSVQVTSLRVTVAEHPSIHPPACLSEQNCSPVEILRWNSSEFRGKITQPLRVLPGGTRH
jgi:hypothetical protein